MQPLALPLGLVATAAAARPAEERFSPIDARARPKPADCNRLRGRQMNFGSWLPMGHNVDVAGGHSPGEACGSDSGSCGGGWCCPLGAQCGSDGWCDSELAFGQ
ncbi:hypothetical protein BDY21DRAFT_365991 [Lineolata rhizophorae]|uniref:Chitin-binding type-1 domain-containing protein n=1 Tax=Lineolata rhizophorae TaxID=578093 RepID=A0A6A6NST6_9PEZI|nr:hypothetical protein BDY21DRAFT_365991 [Lineolata rhizophorae]